MAIEDTDTEFFGRTRGGPGLAARARARREERRRLQPLRSSDPGERAQAATGLVEQGLDRNATALVDFVRDEREPPVLTALAQAVLAAPVADHPDRPEAKLRDWALAEVTRAGGVPSPPAPPAPVVTAPSSSPASSPAPPAPAIAMAAVAEPLVAELSPDDRWRTGASPIGGRSPARPRPAPVAPGPRALTPMAAPVTPATPPPVVGGTIGTGSRDRVVAPSPPAPLEPVEPVEPDAVAAPEPEPEPKPVAPTPAPVAAPEPAPVAAPEPAPAPAPKPTTPRAVTAAAAAPARPAPPPEPAPAQSEPGRDGRASTWRIVKARPVDIVVWDAADPAAAGPAPGSPQPAPPATR